MDLPVFKSFVFFISFDRRHCSHAARAERRDDFVRAEASADGLSHSCSAESGLYRCRVGAP